MFCSSDSTELGSAVGAFGVDPAVTVVTGVLTALRRAAIGRGGHGLQDGPDDTSIGDDGAGQHPLRSRGNVGTVECRPRGAGHVVALEGHHRCGAGGRVTIELSQRLQDRGQLAQGAQQL